MKTFLIGIDNDPPNHILNLLKDRMVDFTDRDYYVQVDYTKIDAHLYIKILSYNPRMEPEVVFQEGTGEFGGWVETLIDNHTNLCTSAPIKFDNSLIDTLNVTTLDLIDNGYELVSSTLRYKSIEDIKRLLDFNNSEFLILFKDVAKFDKMRSEREHLYGWK